MGIRLAVVNVTVSSIRLDIVKALSTFARVEE